MTTYSDRAGAILLRLQDLARDLESHLGLASRSHEAEPMFNRASLFPPQPYAPEAVERAREANIDRFVHEYGDQADRAAFALRAAEVPGVPLTAADAKVRDAVTDLVAAIHNVRTHGDAVALAASLEA